MTAKRCASWPTQRCPHEPDDAAAQRSRSFPSSAPFSEAQRSWLNGFFAGLLSRCAGAAVGGAGRCRAWAGEGDDGEAPWHDQTMPIADRMKLAEGRPLRRRMMAAMAQQDCGQCGYNCNDYSEAIAGKAEARLNLCVPGGKETARMLKALNEELEKAPAASPGSAAPPVVTAPVSHRGTRALARQSGAGDVRVAPAAEQGAARKRKPGISISTSAAAASIMSSAIPSASSRATISAMSIRSSRCSAPPIPLKSGARRCARSCSTMFRWRRRRIRCSN